MACCPHNCRGLLHLQQPCATTTRTAIGKDHWRRQQAAAREEQLQPGREQQQQQRRECSSKMLLTE
jgi:hypothetical protein